MDSKSPNGQLSSHASEASPFKLPRLSLALKLSLVAALCYFSYIWWDNNRVPLYIIQDAVSHVPSIFDLHGQPRDSNDFSWEDIAPSQKFEYTTCYGEFQCARLGTALHWNASIPIDQAATIAVIKKPALVDVTDPRYAGAILLNPGGPGGSGVIFAQLLGEAIQKIVDTRVSTDGQIEAEEKYFDIISFDPRGVGHTLPAAPGINDPGTIREFLQRIDDFGYELDDEQSFNKIYDLYRLYGRVVSSPENTKLANGEHDAQFMSTAYVARDMVAIIEQHGEWREREARRILRTRCGSNKDCIDQLDGTISTTSASNPVLERTSWRKGKEKLQYWGFSYGTVLGQTFASTYPERVGRLVLDGVVNAADYYAGDWKTALGSSEAINANLTAVCAEVGSSVCPIAKWIDPSEQGQGASELLSEFNAYLSSLKTSPVTSLFNHAQAPTFVSHSDAMRALFQTYYTGWVGYPAAARMLYDLSQNNASYFYNRHPPFACPPCSSNNTSPSPGAPLRDPQAAQVAILCTDASPKLQNTTKADWQDYVAEIKQQSPTFFGYLSTILLPCTAHSVRPKWRFEGPIGASKPHLNNPILFVSQTLDPITPLASAEGATELFEDSGLVEAQGVGHCSFGWPNVCAAKEIRAYFNTGETKKERVRCAPEIGAFEDEEAALKRMQKGSEDREMLAVMAEVARKWPPGD